MAILSDRTATVALAVFLSATAPSAVFSLSPDRAITQYGHEIWTAQSGLPGEAVYQIASTANGYLWLRTSNGLVRFDGARFKSIELTAPLDDSVRSICRSAEGNLLIRGWGKTLVLKEDAFANYVPPALLPNGSPRVLFETSRRELWLGTDDLVYVFRNGLFTPVISKTGWVTSILEDHAGAIWIGTISGLNEYKNGELLSYQTGLHEKLLQPAAWLHTRTIRNPALQGEITALAQDGDDVLWIGTRSGLVKMLNGKPVPDPDTQSLASKHISAILLDRDHNLWVGTDSSGLYRITRGKSSSLTVVQGLTDNSILSLHEDREGSLWIGTRSGLDRLRNTKFRTFTTEEGLSHNSTFSLLQARDGSMYIDCEDGGVTRLRDGIATVYTIRSGMTANYGGPIFESRDGSVWIGSALGLSRIKDGKVTVYRSGLSQVYISAIGEDDESLILATSGTPVLRFKDNAQLSPFLVNGGPAEVASSGNYVFIIYRDHEGTLWFGSLKGFYRYGRELNRVGVTRVKQIDFLVFSIYDDLMGNLWLTGATPGLIRFRPVDGNVVKYTAADGLADNEIGRVLSDNQGNLWMSTPRGIFTVSRQDLDAFAIHKIQLVKSVVYGTPDGMKTAEFSGLDHQPAAWKARDGKLWFTTRKGVVVIDPRNIPKNEVAPQVRIEEVLANQIAVGPKAGLRLASSQKSLEIHYTALSFLVPQRVRFQYTLEGYDNKWIDAGTRRVAFYTKIPPGPYRFHVIACNDDGVWNREGASWSFSVAPALYQTAWFRVLCVLAGACLTWALYRLRLQQQVHQMTERVNLQLGERTRIARELHDTLLQNLAGVSLLLDGVSKQIVLAPERAKEQLKFVREQVDSCFRETRLKVWDLRSPELNEHGLPAILREFMQHISRATTAHCEMAVTGQPCPYPAEVEEELLRIAQEALNNAVRHAQPREIHLRLQYESDSLRLGVSDDGRGFAVDEAYRQIGHWGLKNMRDRAAQIGAHWQMTTTEGHGTEITVCVPRSGGSQKSSVPTKRETRV